MKYKQTATAFEQININSAINADQTVQSEVLTNYECSFKYLIDGIIEKYEKNATYDSIDGSFAKANPGCLKVQINVTVE